MPHRLAPIPELFITIVSGVALGFLGIVESMRGLIVAITENDWTRLLGPSGLAVAAVLAVIVLWGTLATFFVSFAKRTTANHKETVVIQRENASALKELVVEGIKAHAKMSHACEKMHEGLSNLNKSVIANTLATDAAVAAAKRSCPNADLLRGQIWRELEEKMKAKE